MTPAQITLRKNRIALTGDWTAQGVKYLSMENLRQIALPTFPLEIDATAIHKLDTAGAMLIYELEKSLQSKKIQLRAVHIKPEHEKLMRIVTDKVKTFTPIPKVKSLNFVARMGARADQHFNIFLAWLSFIGEMTVAIGRLFLRPMKFKWRYFFNLIENTGVNALPIIAFLSLLIGIVLTYQIGVELREYGANIYIIELLGSAILKEFGPLITAIIVIGRTGSAYTAQLGTMQVNQELDALQTMGLSPTDMLVIPRILGLVFVMPLLTVWSDFFGILGGAFMSKAVLGISYTSFLQQFPTDVDLSTFFIGLCKAPVYALLIAAVGCFHGFRVSGSADSIGLQTTRSVVMAIFLIIIADACFSIVLSWLGL
ncbi:MAG: MlaE family lipid ABC transporter permease subunit [Pseudomonadota bacterium]